MPFHCILNKLVGTSRPEDDAYPSRVSFGRSHNPIFLNTKSELAILFLIEIGIAIGGRNNFND
jgi:hypothetical protein